MEEREFIALACRNPVNAALLRRLAEMNLPDCWLVAGCLFQTVWNVTSGREPTHSIADYDVFYFDDADLSWEAEDHVIRLVAEACADLNVEVQVRNQARVYLWYAEKFGPGYPALQSSRDGIDRFLIAGTCIGMRETPEGIEVYAPYGLSEIAEGLLRPNPLNFRPEQFRAKAESYKARWPWLRIVDG